MGMGKKNFSKKAGLLVGLIIMLVALSGCTTLDNFKSGFFGKEKSEKDTIKIGVYEPITGSDSEAAKEELDGIYLAKDIWPEVNGKKIQLIEADNNSDIYAAETAIQDLMNKKPLVVLGSYGSIYSLIANDYIEAKKTPGIAITNINPLVTSNNSYYFRVCFVESYQGEALAKYVVDYLKQDTAAVLAPAEDDQATAMAKTFRDKLKAMTGNEDAVVTTEQFETGEKDFSKHLKAIGESKAKTVFVTGDVTDAANIVKQAEAMGMKLVFLGDSRWGTDEFLGAVGKYAEKNIAFSTFAEPEETATENSEKFLTAYKAKYGEDATPDGATALGFDAYAIAIDAIEKAGVNATGEEVRKKLIEEENFPGASGKITFGSNGDPKKSVVINTIVNYKVKPICTINPDSKNKINPENE
ncbi:MAG: ABC transporter substrate-binding protein [Anaerovoracaceae bacterium]